MWLFFLSRATSSEWYQFLYDGTIAGNVAFLKHAIRIHAALCRPSMADTGFKKATLPGDCDKVTIF